jgi:AcrR family transcriptional regulator
VASAAQTLPTTDTRARILDGAYRAVSTFGLARLTVDDAARFAGVSRQTVYRYFDSKDGLIAALVLREEEAFLEGVRAANERHPDLEDAMAEAVLFCLRTARAHPLLDRLLVSEPETLLPYLTTRGAGLIARARAVIEEMAAARTGVRSELLHRTADVAVRAMISYALTPTDDDPEEVARELARIMASALEVEEEDVR